MIERMFIVPRNYELARGLFTCIKGTQLTFKITDTFSSLPYTPTKGWRLPNAMEIVAIIFGLLGVAGTIYFGMRSKQVERAFTRYVDLEKEVNKLKESDSEKIDIIERLKTQKEDIYRHKYEPKSKMFKPGDAVKLIEQKLKNK